MNELSNSAQTPEQAQILEQRLRTEAANLEVNFPSHKNT
jgi:hypothetical protein